MLLIDAQGAVMDPRIVNAISPSIEHDAMTSVKGIIVHQTGGATAKSALEGYKQNGANGAHFLIDKDGTIYQTASVYKKTWHIGKLKSRCMMEATCSPAEQKLNKRYNPKKENERELKKSVPDRFPANEDSIGIELVGEALPHGRSVPDAKKVYEQVSDAQNDSLKWLVGELSVTMSILTTEIYKHPTVSRKNPTEASTAQWQ
jgi:N-acetyl-anhydromuramyl-L-alanine amidase AmpD